MLSRITLICFTCFVLVSCATNKSLTSDFNANDISDVQYLSPVSYISYIEQGNKPKYNDTISRKSEKLFQTLVKDSPIPVSDLIEVTEGKKRLIYEKEVEFLIKSAIQQKSITNLKITPIVDSLLESSGKRYGLITVATGFTRRKGNYSGQIAKGIAVGVLTMGMYQETPIKSISNVYALIVDSKEDKVKFFNRSLLSEKDPLQEEVLKGQLNKLFEGYFTAK